MRVVLDTNVLIAAFITRTGDNDLLIIKQFRTVDIVRPAEFAEYEAAKTGEVA